METNGVVLAVDDAELLEAKAIIDASGVGCEPASAVSLAGLRQLVGKGVVRPSDSVVAVLTGHILKDPGLLFRYHQEMDPPPVGANRPITIEPDLREIERVLKPKA
jgi:threonine synthase